MPRKLRSSDTDFGAGKSLMPCRYSGFGRTPTWLTICPANSTASPISSFFLDKVKLCNLHLARSWSIRCRSVLMSGAWMRMSSTSFRTPGKPSMTLSERRQNSSLEQDRPIGARRKRKRPEGKRKVVSLELSSSNGTWWYPCVASSLAKTLESGSMPDKISCV